MRVDRNRRVWETALIGAEYGRRLGLQAPEAAILEKFRSEIAGGHILDLGVGAGRTVPFLAALSPDYIGVDYSREMIDRCRRRFPGVSFEVLDARDLSSFADATFDLVLFSFNGIDCVEHDDRLQILKEVRRVLKNGGLYVFSTHNRNVVSRKAWDLCHFDINPLRQPVRFARKLVSFPLGIINQLRNARRNEVREDYSIENDPAHRYSFMLYYITAKAQREQLRGEGFGDIETVGLDGRWLSDEACDMSKDKWIYYVCRRTAIGAPQHF